MPSTPGAVLMAHLIFIAISSFEGELARIVNSSCDGMEDSYFSNACRALRMVPAVGRGHV